MSDCCYVNGVECDLGLNKKRCHHHKKANPRPSIPSRGEALEAFEAMAREQRAEYLDHLRRCAEAAKKPPRATASPYDCGGNPTKEYPGE